ncbi:claudin-13-like [Arvicanthis niloticus]|uniref:claudin-13-like n=1 Tax=Arvicanthis niloticus TaxID=61156 RepID=UPI0014875105|nr:claudin-13-like [Arvicanthis niloticus]
MVLKKQDAISYVITTLGWLSTIMSCVLPVWRVILTDDETNPDASIWEGLWHMCQDQGNGQIQCTWYGTRILVTQDLKVSRVFMVFCAIGTWLGLLLCMVGGDYMYVWRISICNINLFSGFNFKVLNVAGGMFLSAGLLMLIPLSWVTHNIMHGFFNPLLGDLKKAEMGVSLYLAWTSSVLLLLGGILLCVDIKLFSDIPDYSSSESNSNTSDV